MSVSYDTAAIRRAARQVKEAASQLGSISSAFSNLASSVPQALQGESGQALEELMTALKSDTSKMSGGLSTISSRLRSFAAYLDRIDQEAAANIRKN